MRIQLLATAAYVDMIFVHRVILLRDCFGRKEFLLLKRSGEHEFAADQWEFPGGKQHDDEIIHATVEREVSEETSLNMIMVKALVFRGGYVIEGGKHNGCVCINFVSIGRSIRGEVVLSSEHTEYRWVSVEEALEVDLRSDVRTATLHLREQIKTTNW